MPMNRLLRFAALCALLTLTAGIFPAGAAEAARAEEPAPQLCLEQQIFCESDGTYSLILQAWAETGSAAPGPDGQTGAAQSLGRR